jgi:hypothetical protein
MMNFDSPSREVCVVREGRTNTPLQALNLMNDTIYLEASRKLAERMVKGGIDTGVRLVLGRDVRAPERAVLEGALAKFREEYRAHPDEAVAYLSQGASPRDTSIAAPELAAWTGVANLLLNMDEAVTRQ